MQNQPWLISRDFRLVWWSQMISQVADGVSKLALLWFVYSITGSPVKTSVIGLLQTIPPILFSPLIGVSIDRLPRKPILIGTDLLRGLLIGLIPCLISREAFTIEYLYGLVFLYGMATAVFVPALSSSVPLLVPRARFTAANALLQSTTSLGIVLGPAVSGIGIAASSSQDVLCLNTLTYLLSAACLLPIHLAHAPPPRQQGSRLAATLRDLIEGAHFVFRGPPVIVLLIVMASMYTFGTGAFTTLFPIFGRQMLQLGPVEVGYLWSTLGLGLLVVSFMLVRLTEWNLRKRLLAIAASGTAAASALFGLVWTQELAVAALLVGLIGMGIGTLTPIAWGVLQEISPTQLLGRVMGLYTTVATATSMAGMMAFGWIIQEFSEPTGVIGIGLVLLVMALVAAWASRHVHAAGSDA